MLSNKKTIILCSDNEAKIASTQQICTSIFGDFSLYHQGSHSGVSETPHNDAEAIKGCHTRIDYIEKTIDNHVDYIIALEGLIEKNIIGSFVYGWAVIKDTRENAFYYGCSGKVMLPENVISALDKDMKLSEVVLFLYPKTTKSDMDKIGTNGVLTNGLYTRVDEFETALKCAFGSLLSKNAH